MGIFPSSGGMIAHQNKAQATSGVQKGTEKTAFNLLECLPNHF
jgi:hypothetical protein